VSDHFHYLTPDDASPKLRKGRAWGWVSDGHHLAPADMAGPTVCAASTPACRFSCITFTGRGGMLDQYGMNQAQYARTRRTQQWRADPEGYVQLLAREIDRRWCKVRRLRFRYSFRPNATSDLPQLAAALSAEFPRVQFYDYTKLPRPWERVRGNYSLTFSRSETNDRDCLLALANRVNVAVVFSTRKGESLPSTFWGRRVVDGDENDLRFLDPAGVIVGLRAKGRAKHDTSGFVVQVR